MAPGSAMNYFSVLGLPPRPARSCSRPLTRWRGVAFALTAWFASAIPGIGQALEVQGHRGARGLWPENTLAAFQGALSIGVDVLELDVGLTSDGVVLVSHDPRLKGDLARDESGKWLNGPGPVLAQSTAASLAEFDVGRLNPGSAYAGRFPRQTPVDGQTMPRLSQVLALGLTPGAQHVGFNIELKFAPGQPGLYPDPDVLARAVAVEVERAGPAVMERTTIQSFDWSALVAMRRAQPRLRLVALTAQRRWLDNIRLGEPGSSPWTAGLDIDDYDGSVPRLVDALGAKIWSPFWRDLSAESLAQAHRLGIQVVVWTVNKPAAMAALIELGVDGITTDYPDRLRAVMLERGMPLPESSAPGSN